MLKIRRGVFETNSSSVHTISMKRNINPNNYRGRHIDFKFGEFGWENIEFSAADYLYTAIMNIDPDYLDRLKEILDEYEITYTFEDDASSRLWYPHGYIDHIEDLKDFIIDLMEDKSFVISMIMTGEVMGGNDNDEERLEAAHMDDSEYYSYYKGN